MTRFGSKFLWWGLVGVMMWVSFGFTKTAQAADSCSASVSPSTVLTSTQTAFSFSISNTGTGTIQYIKITRPSENFSLSNTAVAGWTVAGNASTAELYDNTIDPGGTLSRACI